MPNQFMQRALELASQGGDVKTNPRVGAVLVKQGKIIGEGFHTAYGKPHAEVEALRSCTVSPKGATLYVTMEPCDHVGKTPPCTAAILHAGIRSVCIGTKDPNPLVKGRGMKKLRASGVETTIIGPELACRALNRPFFTWYEQERPWVTVKMAQSLDGNIALQPASQLWLTSPALIKESHALRSRMDGIIVGVNTILVDNPKLTTRAVKGSSPTRIILDPHLHIPLSAHVITDRRVRTLIITSTRSLQSPKAEQLLERGVGVLGFPLSHGMFSMRTVLHTLWTLGLAYVLIEGGPQTWTTSFKEQMVDEVYLYLTPYLLGGGVPSLHALGIKDLKHAPKLKNVEIKQVGDEIVLHGWLR